MNIDRIEIIIAQLTALKDLWHILRSSSNIFDKEACEELLLDTFESKVGELNAILNSK